MRRKAHLLFGKGATWCNRGRWARLCSELRMGVPVESKPEQRDCTGTLLASLTDSPYNC